MISRRNTTTDSIRNLQAVLYWKDIPLLEICVVNSKLKSLKSLVSADSQYLPLELRGYTVRFSDINKFLESRIIPKRQTLSETLNRLGMVDYSWESILEKTYGTTSYDCYWLKPINSNLKYTDLKTRR